MRGGIIICAGGGRPRCNNVRDVLSWAWNKTKRAQLIVLFFYQLDWVTSWNAFRNIAQAPFDRLKSLAELNIAYYTWPALYQTQIYLIIFLQFQLPFKTPTGNEFQFWFHFVVYNLKLVFSFADWSISSRPRAEDVCRNVIVTCTRITSCAHQTT